MTTPQKEAKIERLATKRGERNSDEEWLTAILSHDWPGDISLGGGRAKVIDSIWELFERQKRDIQNLRETLAANELNSKPHGRKARASEQSSRPFDLGTIVGESGI